MSKKLSQQETRAAQNLCRIYNSKKRELNLTQVKIAEKMGISQVAVSNYINGAISLNLETVLRFAAILEVVPSDIYPEIAKSFGLSKPVKNEVPVIGSTNGGYIQPYITTIEGAVMPHNLALEVIDSTQAPHLPKGSLIIIDPISLPKENDKVLVKFAEDKRMYVLQLLEHKFMRVVLRQAFPEKDTLYTPKNAIEFHMSEISLLFKINTIQFGNSK